MAKVLIVDDATVMRINIRKMLEKLGHEVVGEAVNGFEAIAQYEKLNPDFVTMDITMPQEEGIEDGIEAVRRIRQYDYKAKIIMITSHGEEQKVIKAIQNGASNYLLKPLHFEKFKEILNKLLD
jgi:two-component system, chemotaxis family, chemotaxis protein CheY